MTRRRLLRHARGSALIVTTVLVVILTIIALALVSRNADEIDASGAKRRYDAAVSCADGAREMLMSQFAAYRTAPTSLVLNTTVGDKRYTSGHYNTFQMQSVQVDTSGSVRPVGVSDITDRTSPSPFGGKLYRMTVVCTDSADTSRQDEVEFLVRFGF